MPSQEIDAMRAQSIVDSTVDIIGDYALSGIIDPKKYLEQVAFSAYQAVYISGSKKDAQWDPFRHAYISGKFTQFAGEDTARFVGDMNELISSNTAKETRRDYHKRSYGGKIGGQDQSTLP